MPLMLTEAAAGRFSVSDYVRWSAANPAKIWGLYPRKGVIQAGADADIAIVDLDREWTIDDAKLQSLSRITPFHGRKVKGLPMHTLVRGRFVMKDRTLMPDTRGWGRSVHAIQNLPPPRLNNTDNTMQAIVRAGAGRTGARRMSVVAVVARRPVPRLNAGASFGGLRRAGEGHAHLRPRRAPGSRADRNQSADREGRLHRAGRPVRLRQVHDPQAGHRPDQRLERLRVRGGPPGRRRAGSRRHGVPESRRCCRG